MIQCLSALCVLAVVLVALLVMTNVIGLEQVGIAIGRGLVLLVLTLWAICILESLVAAALSALKTVTPWIAIIASGSIAVAFLLRIISRISTQARNNSIKPEGNHE